MGAGIAAGAGAELADCVCLSCSAGVIVCAGYVGGLWLGIRGDAAADPTVGVKGDAVGVGGAGMMVGTELGAGAGAVASPDDGVGMAVA